MDGKETNLEALPKEGQPSGEVTSPSKPQTKTFTEEEVNRRHAKLDKTISQLTKDREELAARLESIEASQFGEDKDALTKHKEITSLKRERDAAKRELDELREERESFAREKTILRIAQETGVDAKKLDKAYLKTEEDFRDFAATLAPTKPEVKPENTFVADPGGTRGGGNTRTTVKQYDQMSNKERSEFRKKHDNKSILEMIAEGVVVDK